MTVNSTPTAGQRSSAAPREAVLSGLPDTAPEVASAVAVVTDLADDPLADDLGCGARDTDSLLALARLRHVLDAEIGRRLHAVDTTDVLPHPPRTTLRGQAWTKHAAHVEALAAAFRTRHAGLTHLWDTGRISADVMAAIGVDIRTLPPDRETEVLDHLARWIAGHDLTDIRRALRLIVDLLTPNDADAREQRDYDNRALVFSPYKGVVNFHGQLPALEGDLFQKTITALAESLRSEGDGLTTVQRRADALATLLNNQHTTGNVPAIGGLPAAATITISLTEAERVAAGSPAGGPSSGSTTATTAPKAPVPAAPEIAATTAPAPTTAALAAARAGARAGARQRRRAYGGRRVSSMLRSPRADHRWGQSGTSTPLSAMRRPGSFSAAVTSPECWSATLPYRANRADPSPALWASPHWSRSPWGGHSASPPAHREGPSHCGMAAASSPGAPGPLMNANHITSGLGPTKAERIWRILCCCAGPTTGPSISIDGPSLAPPTPEQPWVQVPQGPLAPTRPAPTGTSPAPPAPLGADASKLTLPSRSGDQLVASRHGIRHVIAVTRFLRALQRGDSAS